MKPIRGIVTSVLDGLHIKTESGSLYIDWTHKTELKLGMKVLIFYDFTRQKVREIVAAKKYPVTDDLEETEVDEENENIDHNQLLDMDMERQINNA